MFGDMGYLWAAMLVVWGGIFAFAVSLVYRQHRLQQELVRVARMLDERER